jgi:hypothetical protein
MDRFILDTRFSRCHFEPNVYTNIVGNHLIIFFLYVEDLILTGSEPERLNHVKYILKNKFEMTNLGYFYYFVILQVFQNEEGISLTWSKYACDLLLCFHMEYCKPFLSPF